VTNKYSSIICADIHYVWLTVLLLKLLLGEAETVPLCTSRGKESFIKRIAVDYWFNYYWKSFLGLFVSNMILLPFDTQKYTEQSTSLGLVKPHP